VKKIKKTKRPKNMEAYLKQQQEKPSVAALRKQLAALLHEIKRDAQSMDSQCTVDQLFECEVASLCVSVEEFSEAVQEAHNQIARFIEYSLKEQRTLLTLCKELLKVQHLLTLPLKKTEQGELTTRTPKLDPLSSFNVIKLNTHCIEMELLNRALVVPPPITTTVSAMAMAAEIVVPPGSTVEQEVHQYVQFIVQVRQMATSVRELFRKEQQKMKVYISHREELGRFELLTRLKCVVMSQQKEHNSLLLSMDNMLALLREEKENTQDYVLNTLNRFIECRNNYQTMRALLTQRKIELEQDEEEYHDTPHQSTSLLEVSLCGSMY
jgi:hypothetical protein